MATKKKGMKKNAAKRKAGTTKRKSIKMKSTKKVAPKLKAKKTAARKITKLVKPTLDKIAPFQEEVIEGERPVNEQESVAGIEDMTDVNPTRDK